MRRVTQLSKALPKTKQVSFNMDYASFMNEMALSRTPSALRELMKNHATASSQVIFLGEGLPHGDTMPFSEAKFTLKDGRVINLGGPALVSALNYQPTQGFPPLLEKLRAFQDEFHGPQCWEERDVITTVGAQDGLSKVLELTLTKGDAVVIADPTYSGLMSIIRPYQPKIISASFDKRKGLNTMELKNKLSALWSSRSRDARLPKMMYLNPVGSNPSGNVINTEQKKEIYDIACEYNLIILEDDPYFFLGFQEDLPRSLMSMDTEGRVVRFDTFSKIFSGGMRMGFMTAPKPIVRVVELHMQASVLHTSSLAQVVVLRLLEELGMEGFKGYADNVCNFYRKRRDAMVQLANEHLTGLAEWEVPAGGMFMWMRVKGVPDVWDMVMVRGLKKNVMLVPGHAFMADPSLPCPFIRLSYSIAPMEDIEVAFGRLAELIREEQQLNLSK